MRVEFRYHEDNGLSETYSGNVNGRGFDLLRNVNGTMSVTIVDALGKPLPQQERFINEINGVFNAFKNK